VEYPTRNSLTIFEFMTTT